MRLNRTPEQCSSLIAEREELKERLSQAIKALEAVDNLSVLIARGKKLKEYAIPVEALVMVEEALSALKDQETGTGVSLHSQGRAGSPSDRRPEGSPRSACSSLTQGAASGIKMPLTTAEMYAQDAEIERLRADREAQSKILEDLNARCAWLSDRLAELQLPAHRRQTPEQIHEWLEACGMPGGECISDERPAGLRPERSQGDSPPARPDEGGGRPLPPPPSLTQGDEA